MTVEALLHNYYKRFIDKMLTLNNPLINLKFPDWALSGLPMKIEIIERPLSLNLYGFSGTIINQNYGETGVKLMNRMWGVVKGMKLKNKGINVWIYEPQMKMFAGVELDAMPPREANLENRIVKLTKYAWYKHIGPYHQLKQVNADMRVQLESRGIAYQLPCLEIYGHHTEDENKAETEVIWAV